MDLLAASRARFGAYLGVRPALKVVVLYSEMVAPLHNDPTPHPLSVAGISTSALERLLLSSKTESVRGDLSGGGYGGVFDLK